MPIEKTSHASVQDENAIIKRSKRVTTATTAATSTHPKRRPSITKAASTSSTNTHQQQQQQQPSTNALPSRPALSNVTNTVATQFAPSSTSISNVGPSKIQTRSKSKRTVEVEQKNVPTIPSIPSITESNVIPPTTVTTATTTTTSTSTSAASTSQRLALKRTATESSTQLNEPTNVKRPKPEYEWEDLDADDMDDPLMVCEYVNDIFGYLSELEIKTLPDPTYLEWQVGFKPKMRSILVDWIVEVHLRFRLLPETLFLAINIMDRFMSKEAVQVDKLQLLATGSLFIAAKYEEVYSPSVKNYAYVTDGGYTEEDILTAERYILQVLSFDLSYPNPMNFLRRISKADDYDIETRTVGKYLLEISIMDHRFIGIKPSLSAAAAMFVSRKMLGRSHWNGTLIHYCGGYTKKDMRHVVELMMKYLTEPVAHEEFFKKYASKKYMKSSILARHWAKQVIAEGGDVMDDE